MPNLPPCVRAVLEAGGAAADIGCGEGVSGAVLAAAFPSCTITGYAFSIKLFLIKLFYHQSNS